MREDTWQRRRARAATLAADHAPAEQLLRFYQGLLELQEPLYTCALASDWLETVRAPGNAGPARLALCRLPLPELGNLFHRFVDDVAPVATDALGAVAERLSPPRSAVADATGDDVRDNARDDLHGDLPGNARGDLHGDLLGAYLSGEGVGSQSASLGCETPLLEFFPRAFIQPIAEALARQASEADSMVEGETGTGGNEHRTSQARAGCPVCGWPPQLGVLRDDPDATGRRLLLCSLCASEWAFPRSICPCCGEADADELEIHISESWAHVRVEECKSCQRYVKAVDLREHGLAVPLVDELASVELDLWAEQRGLEKLRKNILGL